jgi:hypothetical protein
VEMLGGDAASDWPPELGRRRGRTAADAGARGSSATAQEGEGKWVPEHRKLTGGIMKVSGKSEEAGIDRDGCNRRR